MDLIGTIKEWACVLKVDRKIVGYTCQSKGLVHSRFPGSGKGKAYGYDDYRLMATALNRPVLSEAEAKARLSEIRSAFAVTA